MHIWFLTLCSVQREHKGEQLLPFETVVLERHDGHVTKQKVEEDLPFGGALRTHALLRSVAAADWLVRCDVTGRAANRDVLVSGGGSRHDVTGCAFCDVTAWLATRGRSTWISGASGCHGLFRFCQFVSILVKACQSLSKLVNDCQSFSRLSILVIACQCFPILVNPCHCLSILFNAC